MNRRKTVSVTPAIGASTVAGEIVTPPIDSEVGTTRVAAGDRAARPPAHPAATELSQNFFTVLFYWLGKTKPPPKRGLDCLGVIRRIRGEGVSSWPELPA